MFVMPMNFVVLFLAQAFGNSLARFIFNVRTVRLKSRLTGF
jgi:hypothetical protein